MSSHVPAALRRLVAERAEGLCEYCLVHEIDTFFGCQVEHIISEKHGGATSSENLAYACVFCNRFKGSDIASIAARTKQLCRLFDPRADHWADHFSLNGNRLDPISDVGEVTARILQFNDVDRLLERDALRAVGRYPTAPAEIRMRGH